MAKVSVLTRSETFMNKRLVEGTKQNSNTDKVHARDRPAQGVPPAVRRRGNDGRPIAEAAAEPAPDADADTEDFTSPLFLQDDE